jgi:hypothetical protein
VLLEGKKKLKSYEPFQAGFVAAEQKAFTVQVGDGFLEIRFSPPTTSGFVTTI